MGENKKAQPGPQGQLPSADSRGAVSEQPAREQLEAARQQLDAVAQLQVQANNQAAERSVSESEGVPDILAQAVEAELAAVSAELDRNLQQETEQNLLNLEVVADVEARELQAAQSAEELTVVKNFGSYRVGDTVKRSALQDEIRERGIQKGALRAAGK